MNGPLSMYNLKPVVHFPEEIDLTPTMYKMKNIYSSSFDSAVQKQDATNLPNIMEQVNNVLKKPSSEVEELSRRQEVILKQLTYLKDQMLVLREELTKKNEAAPAETSDTLDTTKVYQTSIKEPSWGEVTEEVVVHASPDHPPYSLLAVNQLWPSALRVRVTCHTHSSVPQTLPHLQLFSSLASTPRHNLHVRLIWKQMGPDCELIISPLRHCPVRGEVNLLRYLWRSVTAGQGDPLTVTQQDSVLDTCHRLSHARTQRDKMQHIRALNARLGKAMWLGGEVMSLTDLAAFSVLRSISGVEVPQNLSKWKSRYCTATFFEAA